MSILVAVPVKRFFVAKRRLSPLLTSEARAALGRDLARRTLSTVAATGTDVVALAADEEVALWANDEGWEAMVDTDGGLDGAAGAAAARAQREGRSWMIIHADLPLLAKDDVEAALEILAGGSSPLAPSADGGTSLIGGTGTFRFSYGRASFHRHLSRLAAPRVLVRTRLALDLDGPDDFAAASRRPEGRWLQGYAGLS